ncbi:MAG: hypothetical protein ABI559_10400 [Chloroflexota bacterium]
MTSTRLIIAAMAAASAVLIGVGVGLAFGAFDSGGTSGPPGSIDVTENCQKYGTDMMNKAKLTDPWLKGIVTVGFDHGPDGPAAVKLLNTLGTAYYLALPFRDQAWICVKVGYEDEWAAKLKALDWVEFAHKEGVSACQPNCHLRN